jgi:8-oxo-dGTP pyrophosphatase MutT (NUDIX family)
MKIKKLSSKVVHQNPWFSIRHDRIDQGEGDYFILETPPAVFIVALTEKEEIYLIGQERYPTQLYSWEVPGGRSDGQPLPEAAQRELKEETGIEAEGWEEIGKFQTMNGVSNEISHVFLARGLKQTAENKQAEEGITELKKVPFKNALDLVKSGEITDGQTIAALMQVALKMGYIK